MIKRWFILLLAASICAVCLTGCGGEKARKTQPAAPTVTVEEQQEMTDPSSEEPTAPENGKLSGEGAAEAFDANASGGAAGKEVKVVDGIKVFPGEAWKMGPGALNYTPGDDDGYFAVNSVPIPNTQIAFSIDGSGILNYKLKLELTEDKMVKTRISVEKNGKELVSYERDDVMLKAGSCELDACVDTKEEAPCSGKYLVRVWINDVLVSETLNEL